jgi:uncharacterized membrane protein
MSSNNDCITYNWKIWELIFPSSSIFKDLCIARDKTSLFILTVLRCLIYLVIFKIIYTKASLFEKYANKLLIGIFIVIMINLISLVCVILKTPKTIVKSEEVMESPIYEKQTLFTLPMS